MLALPHIMLATSGVHVFCHVSADMLPQAEWVHTDKRMHIQTDLQMCDATQTMCCTDVVLFAMNQKRQRVTLFPDAGL